MEKQDFIKMYVANYVSTKMAQVNRNEVIHGDLVEKHTLYALREAERSYETYHSQLVVPN